jgi:hypothetical protein
MPKVDPANQTDPFNRTPAISKGDANLWLFSICILNSSRLQFFKRIYFISLSLQLI